MRMRRSQNNRPFRRGHHKPRGMEGLPADEPDLPLPGAKPAEAAPVNPAGMPGVVSPADPTQSAPGDLGAPAAPVEPPPPPLPPGPHLEVAQLQAMPTKSLARLPFPKSTPSGTWTTASPVAFTYTKESLVPWGTATPFPT